jgi:Flp pilus assembly protein TadD
MMRLLMTLMFTLYATGLFAGNLNIGMEPYEAQASNKATASNSKINQCAAMTAEEATKLGLIRQILADGKPHAAIAHLDAAKIVNPQASLLRADGLRQTGREAQASGIYRELLSSCVAGHANQGLGLIAAKHGKISEAVSYLELASQALPTEPTIRNDHGYVLMLAGDNKAALHEFLTAVELAAGYQQAAHNLILLLYREGDKARAEVFANQLGISKEKQTQLEDMAKQPLVNVSVHQEATGRQP